MGAVEEALREDEHQALPWTAACRLSTSSSVDMTWRRCVQNCNVGVILIAEVSLFSLAASDPSWFKES